MSMGDFHWDNFAAGIASQAAAESLNIYEQSGRTKLWIYEEKFHIQRNGLGMFQLPLQLSTLIYSNCIIDDI